MIKSAFHFVRLSRRSESGTASVEFAFIGAILICFTLGAVELGRITYVHQKLASAAGQATRLVEMGATYAEIQDALSSEFSPNERLSLTLNVGPHNMGGVSYTRIHIQYAVQLLVPGLGLIPDGMVNLNALQLVPTS